MQCSKTWLENKGISAVIFDFDGTLYDNSKVAKYLMVDDPPKIDHRQTKIEQDYI